MYYNTYPFYLLKKNNLSEKFNPEGFMRKRPPFILEVRNQMVQCLQARGKKHVLILSLQISPLLLEQIQGIKYLKYA